MFRQFSLLLAFSICQCTKANFTNESVQVAVRCRPLSEKELQNDNYSIVEILPTYGIVEIKCPKTGMFQEEFRKTFKFDMVYDCNSTQDDVYENSIRPLVKSVLDGFNGCVFAYGQTGTGKTYTMAGNEDNVGIIPKTFKQIWEHIDCTANMQFLVTVSYLEIYLEEIKDLLKRDHQRKLEIREYVGRGIIIPNLHTVTCKNADEMLAIMNMGDKNRTVGCTNMNERSSRSHAVFSITIEMCDTEDEIVKIGKLNLVDLAGSERQSKTGSSTDRLKEATKINRALSSLGNVISALAENSPYVPYRDSKLTRLLQNSLGGNSKTVIIANIGPSNYNYEESLTTLRYAHRAKTIKNTPIKNEDAKDAKLRKYREEIKQLKALIEEQNLRNRQNEEEKIVVVEKIVTVPLRNEQLTTNEDNLLERLREEQRKTEELKKRLEILESQLVSGGRNSLDKTESDPIDEQIENDDYEFEWEQEEDITEIDVNDVQESSKISTADPLQNLHELEMLEKELKLKTLIIDNFIPVEEKRSILNQACYNSESDQWILPLTIPDQIISRPIAREGFDHPISNYALHRIQSNVDCPYRYRSENILNLTFEKSAAKTTRSYSQIRKRPQSQIEQILNDAMQEESDIEIDASDGVVFGTNSSRIQEKLDTIAKNLEAKRKMERTKLGKNRCLSSNSFKFKF